VIISFAWTTPALLSGAKTMTRRDWTPQYAAKFKPGMLVDAWNMSPRTGKGRKIATIRIEDVVEERSLWIPSDDIFPEGVMWSMRHGVAVPDGARDWNAWWTEFKIAWHQHGGYRIGFELVERVSSPAVRAAPDTEGGNANLSSSRGGHGS
jgi:hypothetical protein